MFSAYAPTTFPTNTLLSTTLNASSMRLTWWLIVADSEEWLDVRTGVAKMVSTAIGGVTAYRLRLPPYQLGEVTVAFEISAWVSLPIQSVKPIDLPVIEHVGDDRRYVIWPHSCSDVLAIPSTCFRPVERLAMNLRSLEMNTRPTCRAHKRTRRRCSSQCG